jgi:hypothetical protein
VRNHLDGHDRVVILTDEQAAEGDVGHAVPASTPLYTWNLARYRHGHAPSGGRNRHTFGGLTDQAFQMIPLLEVGIRRELAILNVTWSVYTGGRRSEHDPLRRPSNQILVP